MIDLRPRLRRRVRLVNLSNGEVCGVHIGGELGKERSADLTQLVPFDIREEGVRFQFLAAGLAQGGAHAVLYVAEEAGERVLVFIQKEETLKERGLTA